MASDTIPLEEEENIGQINTLVTRVSPHLAGLEVAEDHHHPVLHLSLGDELDQARDHSPEQIEIK